MNELAATLAGLLAMGTVLALAAAARPRRASRRPPDPAPEAATAHPARRHARRTVAVLAGAFLAGGAVVLVGVVAVVLGVACGLLVHRQRRRVEARQRSSAIEAAMPDAVELLVLCVRAGLSPTQAVVELVARAPPPTRPAFAAVELRLHRGHTLADALDALQEHAGRTGRDIGHAIAAADRDGLPLAPVLDRLAADARTTRRRLGDIAARRLPVRLTFPLVTCTLPAFVLVAIAPAVIGALSTLQDRVP